MGGSAQSVAVLSADVDMKEKSVGCQRPDMTLSVCCATTTEGNGNVKSP